MDSEGKSTPSTICDTCPLSRPSWLWLAPPKAGALLVPGATKAWPRPCDRKREFGCLQRLRSQSASKVNPSFAARGQPCSPHRMVGIAQPRRVRPGEEPPFGRSCAVLEASALELQSSPARERKGALKLRLLFAVRQWWRGSVTSSRQKQAKTKALSRQGGRRVCAGGISGTGGIRMSGHRPPIYTTESTWSARGRHYRLLKKSLAWL